MSIVVFYTFQSVPHVFIKGHKLVEDCKPGIWLLAELSIRHIMPTEKTSVWSSRVIKE